jgi:hypothetical protein
VWQQIILRIHTQAKLHTASVIQTIIYLVEEVAALSLHEIELLNLIEFIVVVSRGANFYELYADTLIVKALGIQLYCYLALATYVSWQLGWSKY